MANFLTDFNSVISGFEPALSHFLIFGLVLFIFGITILISSGNLVKSLVGLCFMLNAAILNFAAANSFITKENSFINLGKDQTDTVLSAFAPLYNITQNFTMPVGQAGGLITAILGAAEILTGFGLVYCIFLKHKNTGLSLLAALKSDESRKEGDFNG